MNAFEKFGYYTALYLDDVKHQNKSVNTVNNYANAFKVFKEFWSSRENEFSFDEDPRTPLFREWRNYMTECGLKPSTIKQRLMALHIFYSFFEDEEDDNGDLVYDGKNPVSKKLYPKQEQRPYDIILGDDLINKLWRNVPPSHRQKQFWARNYAIVCLLLDSKIRNSELLDLKLSDIDFEEKLLYVENGKGKKFRCADLSDISITALRLYLASGIRPAGLKDGDYLFGTRADKSGLGKTDNWHRGTSDWLSDLVERHVKTVTGVDHVRSHDLRHVGARLALNNGESKEQIQTELGHASVRTTEIYSGRLEARRGRQSAKEVYAERDIWAEKNRTLLANMGIA